MWNNMLSLCFFSPNKKNKKKTCATDMRFHVLQIYNEFSRSQLFRCSSVVNGRDFCFADSVSLAIWFIHWHFVMLVYEFGVHEHRLTRFYLYQSIFEKNIYTWAKVWILGQIRRRIIALIRDGQRTPFTFRKHVCSIYARNRSQAVAEYTP